MTVTLGELQCAVERLDKDARTNYQTLSDVWATQKRMDNRIHKLEEVGALTTKLERLAGELRRAV